MNSYFQKRISTGPIDDVRKRLVWRRQHKFSLAYIAISVLLAFVVKESMYEEMPYFRLFVDRIVALIPSIDEFAKVSDSPSVTRMVLAFLWASIFPLIIVMDVVPDMLLLRADLVRKAGWLLWISVIPLAAFLFAWPLLLTIDDAQVSRPHGLMHVLIRLMSGSRFFLGLFGGIYCLVEAFFIFCIFRIITYKIFARDMAH